MERNSRSKSKSPTRERNKSKSPKAKTSRKHIGRNRTRSMDSVPINTSAFGLGNFGATISSGNDVEGRRYVAIAIRAEGTTDMQHLENMFKARQEMVRRELQERERLFEIQSAIVFDSNVNISIVDRNRKLIEDGKINIVQEVQSLGRKRLKSCEGYYLVFEDLIIVLKQINVDTSSKLSSNNPVKYQLIASIPLDQALVNHVEMPGIEHALELIHAGVRKVYLSILTLEEKRRFQNLVMILIEKFLLISSNEWKMKKAGPAKKGDWRELVKSKPIPKVPKVLHRRSKSLHDFRFDHVDTLSSQYSKEENSSMEAASKRDEYATLKKSLTEKTNQNELSNQNSNTISGSQTRLNSFGTENNAIVPSKTKPMDAAKLEEKKENIEKMPGKSGGMVLKRTLTPSPRQKAGLFLAKAKYNYEASDKMELSFKKGDILTVLDRHESGWWGAQLNGRTGLVPRNYLLHLSEFEL